MSYNVTIFGIHLKLSPIAFSIPIGSGHWDIYWYGIIIATGFLLALIYGLKNAPRYGLNSDRMLDVILVATPVAILSARTYYVIFDGEKLNGIGDFFGFGTSSGFAGLAIYGGVIGGFLGGFVMCKIRKVNFRAMADIASLGFLIGQCIGRWGNFINQEAFGAQCSPDWIFGMTSVDIIRRDGLEAGALVHPCFLYESVWCLVGFIALHFYSKKLRTFDGEIMLMYLAWYGLGRAWIEGLRTDSLMAGDFRISQVVAAACFAVCTVLVIVFKILTEKKHIPLYVNTEACRALNEADEKAEEQRREKKLAKKTEQAPSILSEDAENVTLNDDSSESSESVESSKSSEPETVSSEETETSESPEAANETTETSDETDESEEQ